jgi:hypothetical protein
VASDNTAVHFSQGAAPTDGGAFPEMFFHEGAITSTTARVPTYGFASRVGMVGVDAATTTHKVHLSKLPSNTGTTTVFQAYSTKTCGWCTVDENTKIAALAAQRALHELPNQVVDGASVAMNANALGHYGFTISFGASNPGNQNEITLQGAGCNDDGCQPRYHGAYVQQVFTHNTGTIEQDSSTSKYTYRGTTETRAIKGTDCSTNANTCSTLTNHQMVRQGECAAVGGEKFVPYYYISTGDSTGTVLDVDACTQSGKLSLGAVNPTASFSPTTGRSEPLKKGPTTMPASIVGCAVGTADRCGTGLTVTITTDGAASSAITTITVTDPGEGYEVGNVITITNANSKSLLKTTGSNGANVAITFTLIEALFDWTGYGLQLSTDSIVASSNLATTMLRLRKLSDFREFDEGAYSGLQDKSNTIFRSVTTEITRGTTESTECSGRGLCDGSSGLCECFEGYTGEACSTQTVLI